MRDILFEAGEIKNIQKITELNNEELEERITAIDDLFVYMEVQRLDSYEVKEKLDKIVTRIYESEMKVLEKEFKEKIELYLGDEAEGDFYGEYRNGESVKINTNQLYKMLMSSDFNQRMSGCKEIIHTIAHEIQHHRQYIMATSNVTSKEALSFAKDFAIHDILGKKYYEYNYGNIGTENNANEIALKKQIEAEKYDRTTSIYMLQYKINENLSQYEVRDVETEDGEKYDIVRQDKEEIMDEVLDREICINKKLNLLTRYPILQKKYNLNGTNKRTNQLIDEMESEREDLLNNRFLSHEEAMQAIKDSEDMYLDLIYKSLPKITKGELKLIEKKKLRNILNKMERKFENEADELMDIEEEFEELRDKDAEETEGKKPLFFKYKIKRDNRRQHVYVGNRIYNKLASQKKVIAQARRGKVPKEPINFGTQALKVMRPVDKFMGQVSMKLNKLGKPVREVIRKLRIPEIKNKIVRFFKERKRSFSQNTNDEITEKLIDDEITERLIDDEKTERLINNKTTEKKVNTFKNEMNIKNWDKNEQTENSRQKQTENSTKEQKENKNNNYENEKKSKER